MPVDRLALDALARRYVAAMTSIRGRRVHRLLMREFARFDLVVAGTAEDGSPVLVALGEDGRVAVCATDGRGSSAQIVESRRLADAVLASSYDLLKDSLPVVGWTLALPGPLRVAGTVTIAAAELPPGDGERFARLVRAAGAGG